MANMSNTLDTFNDKICIKVKTIIIKIANASNENTPTIEVIIKNHKVNPADTANALNLGEDSSILNRINEGY